MSYNIVNGFTGLPHNGPVELTDIVSAILGSTARVYDWGGKFATTVSANGRTATVKSGAMSIQGWLAVSNMDEQLPIDAGVAGQKRNDLIVARIRREGNIDTGTQRFALEVVKGAATTGTPTDPSIVAANADSMALYRIPIDGVTVKTPVRMFTPNSTINAMGDSLSQTSKDVAALKAAPTPVWQKISIGVRENGIGGLGSHTWKAQKWPKPFKSAPQCVCATTAYSYFTVELSNATATGIDVAIRNFDTNTRPMETYWQDVYGYGILA